MNRIRAVGAALLILLPLAAPPARAADEASLELRVKAAFLYNFARYFSWPPGKFADAGSPLQVCVLEPDPFGPLLERALGDKKVNQRPLQLRRAASAESLRDCHVVYSSLSESADLEKAFAPLAGAGVVTVHEAARAIPLGVVRFFRENRKVRFEINTLAAAREHLELSLTLQNLAVTVRK